MRLKGSLGAVIRSRLLDESVPLRSPVKLAERNEKMIHIKSKNVEVGLAHLNILEFNYFLYVPQLNIDKNQFLSDAAKPCHSKIGS